MNTLYADVNHVNEGIRRLRQNATLEGEDFRLEVFDSDAVMRGITYEEAKERNLVGNIGHSLCHIGYDGVRFTLGFHENQTEGTFKLRPAGHEAINANQASRPDQIAPPLAPIVDAIEADNDFISWDFTEVNAASMANGGHFTDFEFEYVITGL